MEHYKSRAPEQEGLQAVPVNDPPEVVPHQQQLYYDKPNSTINYSPTGGRAKKTCGLRRSTFLLALLLALALIAAAVIGGVLGSRKTTTKSSTTANPATQTSSSSGTSSPTPSSTTSANGFVAPTGITVALDCPKINQTTINSFYAVNSGTFSYNVTCGQDCSNENIFPIWAYSLDTCVEACVNLNNGAATDTECRAVAFRADMGNVTTLGGNCFLKTNCSQPVVQPLALIAHAVLVT